ncbi:MAG: hypothetical protein DDT32_00422 [Syntrophomonadaceae bacterium]|nr:hypothetical protein [Bacillota bacterium]
MKQLKKGVPALKGVIEDGQISVWCPFCCKFHQHGWLGKPGYRVAHCSTDNPLSATGYFVLPFSKKELVEMAIALEIYG